MKPAPPVIRTLMRRGPFVDRLDLSGSRPGDRGARAHWERPSEGVGQGPGWVDAERLEHAGGQIRRGVGRRSRERRQAVARPQDLAPADPRAERQQAEDARPVIAAVRLGPGPALDRLADSRCAPEFTGHDHEDLVPKTATV